MLFRTAQTTLIHIVCEIILNFQASVKCIKVPDDNAMLKVSITELK